MSEVQSARTGERRWRVCVQVGERNGDLELDDTKKRSRRLDQLLPGVADDYDVAFLGCPPSVSIGVEEPLTSARA
jgi:cellulose biosynthesis protein BcsQ